MRSAWFTSMFLRVFKFLQIKEGGPNFLGEPILQKIWIIWFALLYFNLKILWTQFIRHSLDFKAFCRIQEHFSESFEISTN